MRDIRTYLDERDEARTHGLERGSAAGLLRRVSSFERRQAVKVQAARLLAPLERRKAQRLQGPLRLNLGSGPRHIPGWVNVDVVGMGPDLHWDLTRPLPFPDGVVEAVFLEHVIEHFPLGEVLDMLAEVQRLLAPGGILRIGVPDFGRYLESYAGDRAFIEGERPGRPTALLAVGEVAQGHGHRSVWDAETLELVLTEAGFEQARRRAFGDSDLDPAPDSAHREGETLYAEGRVPV